MIKLEKMPRGPGRVRGMSLIEVMVSMLVLAIGLLGMAAMQSLALRGGQSSLESSQAVMQTTSIIEAIRANRVNAANYNIAKTCASSGIAGSSLAANDLRAWLDSMQSTIGSAVGDAAICGRITNCLVGAPGGCQVTVFWDDTRAGGDVAREIVVETRI